MAQRCLRSRPRPLAIARGADATARPGNEPWPQVARAGTPARFADLDALARTPATGPLASLASSTRASFLRQLGHHVGARSWDGRAFALAGSDPEAGADALIGLAADALGIGRFALSGTAAAAGRRDARGTARRGDCRCGARWVSAELAMFTGDGAAAVGHAERAVELAGVDRLGATRRQVGCGARRGAVQRRAMQRSPGVSRTPRSSAAERLGLMPLTWALACLLGDVGSAVHSPHRIAEIRDESADTVRRRGGVWAAPLTPFATP